MAVMFVQGGEVSIYLPLANRLYEGQVTPEFLSQFLGMNTDLSELMEALMGRIRLPPSSDILDYRAVEDGYRLSFKRPDGHQEVHVSTDGLRVFREESYDIHGHVFLVKTFQDHRVIDGVVRPGEVHLVLPDREEELRLTFIDQEVNQPIREEEFQRQFPDSVERIYLQSE
jgi:hypothetical protein